MAYVMQMGGLYGQDNDFGSLRSIAERAENRAQIAVKGGEKPDQRAEQNTASAAVGVRWSEGVRIRLGAAGAGNAGRA